MKRILVLNAGSSSLKFKLYELLENNQLVELKKGDIDSIGTVEGPKNHRIALSLLFDGFGIRSGSLQKIEGLVAIAHRVVYGGAKYSEPVIISKHLLNEISKFNELAPLHNPVILEVIDSVNKSSGQRGHRTIDNYAVFDTGYYQNLPLKAKIYSLPYKFYEQYGIQRFGFHGLSHENAYCEIVNQLGKPKNMISIHLGAGSSITAIKDGNPIDTSMGFTPQEGLMMSTRCGDIDPGIITYLMRNKGLNYKQIDQIINKESGLMGISQSSSEMRDILYLAGHQIEDEKYMPNSRIKNLPVIYHERAKLALEIYCYRVQKYISSYYGILGGLDVLAFTGMIGYHSSIIRNMITKDIKHLLVNSKIAVVPTDEELQIAKKIIPFIK